jgi:hypothetical protein
MMIITLFFSIISAWSLELKGVAKSIDKKDVLYTELHQITKGENGLNKFIETKYIDQDGKTFATMRTDFSKSPVLPSISFEDTRFSLKEELSWDDDGKHVRLKIIDTKGTQEKKFPVTDKMIAGQGFDNFIKSNYESMRKNPLPIKFGVLSSMDFYSFKGYQKEKSSDKSDKFGISLTNFVLRLFADELLVEYDPKTKQLLSYRGLSNIMTSSQKSQNVHIDYEIVRP